jgi:hypothetical protein
VSTIKWFPLILALILAACRPIPADDPSDAPWRSADLRVLELPDRPDAAYDLVSAYARLTKSDLELRFDFLGSPDPLDYELYVAVDTGQGGGGRLPFDARPNLDWDIALGFPTWGLPRAFSPEGVLPEIRPRIHRDGMQDAAIIRIARHDLRGNPITYRIFAYVVKPGERQVADSIGPVLVGGAPPLVHAPLYIAFWDAFPAATPAQALRRWSGAHTGPYGQRHGLSVLLQAASRNNVPVTVLDIKSPEQLSALEAVGGIDLVRQMVKSDLLLLPDQSYGDPQASSISLQFSKAAGKSFKLGTSPFRYSAEAAASPGSQSTWGVYALGNDVSGTYRAAFARLQNRSHLLAWNEIRLVPLPEPGDLENPQADGEGLTISVRQALLEAALSSDLADMVVLGGELPNSPWGDSQIAAPAFRYIAGHPWVRTLNGKDLLEFPAIEGAPDCPDLLCLPIQKEAHPHQALILQTLRDSPESLFRDLAWQTYLRLTDPTPDTRLQALRAGYLGQVGSLLAATRWNAAPVEQSACAEDWNWDGAAECILSSPDIFLAIDPLGGRIVLAAARVGNQEFEIIGPRSQFVIGLGDAVEWRPERGLSGDPQDIPGAFADPPDFTNAAESWARYQAEAQPGEITLKNPQNGTRKTFRLTGQGIQISIECQQSFPTQIPLALISKGSYGPGGFGHYQSTTMLPSITPQGYIWRMDQTAIVQITVEGAKATIDSFSDSRSFLNQPEDPNIGYPPGHFVPFPLSVINLQPEKKYSVEMHLEQP